MVKLTTTIELLPKYQSITLEGTDKVMSLSVRCQQNGLELLPTGKSPSGQLGLAASKWCRGSPNFRGYPKHWPAGEGEGQLPESIQVSGAGRCCLRALFKWCPQEQWCPTALLAWHSSKQCRWMLVESTIPLTCYIRRVTL